MKTIPLGTAGRTTSRLGFGTSSVMGALNRRQSLAMLESAYDAGIRHFDTAPMYGYGEAEACLGEFLRNHRGELTVTTKFGVPSTKSKTLVRVARAVIGPWIQRFPGLKKQLQRPRSAATANEAPLPARTANPIFTAERARASLENSLRALAVDRIDLWLLHDVHAVDLPQDAKADPLLRFMEDAVRDGKIGSFGVGSDRNAVPLLLAQHPAYCPVTQYEWSVLNPAEPETPHLRIHHRALSERFRGLRGLLEAEPENSKRWSAEIGADLLQSGMMAHLMLKASYLLNPASVLLFSSKSPKHIHGNVAAVGDVALDGPALRLYELFQREQPMA